MHDFKFSSLLNGHYDHVTATLFIIAATLSTSSHADTGNAEVKHTKSKRIEIYSLSQNYWDIQSGDTLSEIVQHLLPNNPSKYEVLKKDIVRLNPHAFINGDAERLLTGKRLQLPGYMRQADSVVNPATTQVERFSWGNIKRQK